MNADETSVIEQILFGRTAATGDTALCQRCNAELGEGDTITVYAYRRADEQLVSVARLYCGKCDRRSIKHPARGCDEWLVETRLALTADVARQSHDLTLCTVEMLDACGPRDSGNR